MGEMGMGGYATLPTYCITFTGLERHLQKMIYDRLSM